MESLLADHALFEFVRACLLDIRWTSSWVAKIKLL